MAVKRYVKSITKAIKNNEYVSLIQQMIMDNANSLSRQDLDKIKATLIEIEKQINII